MSKKCLFRANIRLEKDSRGVTKSKVQDHFNMKQLTGKLDLSTVAEGGGREGSFGRVILFSLLPSLHLPSTPPFFLPSLSLPPFGPSPTLSVSPSFPSPSLLLSLLSSSLLPPLHFSTTRSLFVPPSLCFTLSFHLSIPSLKIYIEYITRGTEETEIIKLDPCHWRTFVQVGKEGK